MNFESYINPNLVFFLPIAILIGYYISSSLQMRQKEEETNREYLDWHLDDCPHENAEEVHHIFATESGELFRAQLTLCRSCSRGFLEQAELTPSELSLASARAYVKTQRLEPRF